MGFGLEATSSNRWPRGVVPYKLGTVGAGHTGKEHGGREK
jgi:hypothetical protein